MYYDKSTYTAYWVAYPLAKDTWETDVPTNGSAIPDWPNPNRSTSGRAATGSISELPHRTDMTVRRVLRPGHQIPNADRNGSDELVVQTYYATNSTPQIQNKFNGGIWQQLESGVRNIAATTDTVYVVTGAILQTAGNHEAITWITPKSDSKRCPVPNYYYKALLKVRRDASNKVTSAMTIGFWMEHRSTRTIATRTMRLPSPRSNGSPASISSPTCLPTFRPQRSKIRTGTHSHRSKRAKRSPTRQNDASNRMMRVVLHYPYIRTAYSSEK